MANPLAETHVSLNINIFDQTQHALVRRHLTIDRLIADILREFALELDLNRKYILIYDGRQLDPDMVIGELTLGQDPTLTFGYYEPVRAMGTAPTPRRTQSTAAVAVEPRAGTQTASLREMETGQRYLLQHEQTIIGRGGGGTTERIDVDLSGLRDGRTVSRPHARISTADSGYVIEPLKEDRPTYLNNDEVAYGRPRPLKHGDVIGVGRIQLVFELT